jgi:hypothetical protein
LQILLLLISILILHLLTSWFYLDIDFELDYRLVSLDHSVVAFLQYLINDVILALFLSRWYVVLYRSASEHNYLN